MSPVFGESGQSGRKRSSRSAKRARTEETESISTTSTAEGDIQIVEADPEGNFIKLFNTGAEVIAFFQHSNDIKLFPL